MEHHLSAILAVKKLARSVHSVTVNLEGFLETACDQDRLCCSSNSHIPIPGNNKEAPE